MAQSIANKGESIEAAADRYVSSSELVRQFGAWQHRALSGPIYIVHRGTVRFVMVTTELMEALTQEHGEAGPDADETIQIVIDGYDEAAIVFDSSGRLVTANSAARARFDLSRHRGRTAALLSRAGGAFLQDAIGRVLASGTSESIAFTSDRHPDRQLIAHIRSLPIGCMVVVRDETPVEELREERASSAALIAALEASGTTAAFRLSPRGTFVAPGVALASMVGASVDQLATARLTALIATSDRAAITDLIEQTFASGTRGTANAALLIRGSTSRTAVISMAPVKSGIAVLEIVGTITLA